MAGRESPKSMFQAFIENVPTTAPLKRTRSIARSPEFQSKETAPNRKKRRTRSSFVVIHLVIICFVDICGRIVDHHCLRRV
jgi:hypothetical protein